MHRALAQPPPQKQGPTEPGSSREAELPMGGGLHGAGAASPAALRAAALTGPAGFLLPELSAWGAGGHGRSPSPGQPREGPFPEGEPGYVCRERFTGSSVLRFPLALLFPLVPSIVPSTDRPPPGVGARGPAAGACPAIPLSRGLRDPEGPRGWQIPGAPLATSSLPHHVGKFAPDSSEKLQTPPDATSSKIPEHCYDHIPSAVPRGIQPKPSYGCVLKPSCSGTPKPSPQDTGQG